MWYGSLATGVDEEGACSNVPRPSSSSNCGLLIDSGRGRVGEGTSTTATNSDHNDTSVTPYASRDVGGQAKKEGWCCSLCRNDKDPLVHLE